MSKGKPLRLGILISGSGRTLLNLHEQIASGKLPAVIACVVSSREGALGVDRARQMGLAVHVVPRNTLNDTVFHDSISRLLDVAEVDLVCMAGFCTLWRIPSSYSGRVINIHPALLPAYGGAGYFGHRVHEAVIASGTGESGCTVHYCDNEYDHGPIILQRKVTVERNDTPGTLAARVFEQECIAYPEAIRLFAADRISLADGKVSIVSDSDAHKIA